MAILTPELKNSPFLRACRKETTPYTPIWLLRQAGRYMPQYRSVRDKVSFLELCKSPELASEVTITAANELNVDAAIIFADILLITEAMGFDLTFAQGEGPKILNPFRSKSHLSTLKDADVDELHFVYEAITLTRRHLKPEVPLIGFAGAPFTVASYIIEGESSKTFEQTHKLMRDEPELWHALLSKIAVATGEYLLKQIEAGAQAVQLFDSWIGRLTGDEYRQYALPYTQTIFRSLPKEIPAIHFGTGTAPFLKDFQKAGGNVIGLDHGISIQEAWNLLGDVVIQGNLNPEVLLKDQATLEKATDEILAQTLNRPGFIFNVGHGIRPTTPVENVKHLVQYVHEKTKR